MNTNKRMEELLRQREKIAEHEKAARAKLKERRKQLNARIRRVETVTKRLDRKQETRRKILIGSFVLSRLEQGRGVEFDDNQQLMREIDSFLTRDYDREVFGLEPLETEGTENKTLPSQSEGEAQGEIIEAE